jgi:hypothetical protein
VTTGHFTKTYKYRRLTLDGVPRPYLAVRIAANGIAARYYGLLDSGSDRCVLSSTVARALRIDWRQGRALTVGGVAGMTEVYVHTVSLHLDPLPTPIECEAWFTSTLPRGANVVLGRQCIFESLLVGFDESAKEFYLARKD